MMEELHHKIIEESVRGGPAYFRPSYMATDKYAMYWDESREDRQLARGKVIYVKLPWLFAIVRVPIWSPIGVSLD